MGMREAIGALNDLVRKDIIKDYAVGGGTAALAYLEPTLTFDVDVFVVFSDAMRFDVLTPIYDCLKNDHAATFNPEHPEVIVVHGVAFQFLEATKGLLLDALNNAKKIPYEDVELKVFTAEYLIAICLQTGRGKDSDRVRMFYAAKAFDAAVLSAILSQYKLVNKWNAITV